MAANEEGEIMTSETKTNLLKTDDPLFKYSVDMLLIGVSLLIMGAVQNGIIAVYQAVVCVTVSVICEYIGFKLVTKQNHIGDLSAVSTGLIISLLLPSCAPLWLGACASAFAILVAKLPFGGARNAPFVPAAAGISFANICFSELMSTYAASSSGLSAVFSTEEGFESGASLLSMLKIGADVDFNIFNITSILSGSYPGAIGTTCILALLGVMIYIFIQRPSRLISSIGCILAAAIFAAAFPRVSSGIINSVVLELCAGSLLFNALLIVNDPVTSPKKPLASFIYGAITGIICMLLRRYAKIEDTGCFSVMIINAVWPVISRKTATDQSPDRKLQSILKKAAKLDKKSVSDIHGQAAKNDNDVTDPSETSEESSAILSLADSKNASGGDTQ